MWGPASTISLFDWVSNFLKFSMNRAARSRYQYFLACFMSSEGLSFWAVSQMNLALTKWNDADLPPDNQSGFWVRIGEWRQVAMPRCAFRWSRPLNPVMLSSGWAKRRWLEHYKSSGRHGDRRSQLSLRISGQVKPKRVVNQAIQNCIGMSGVWVLVNWLLI